VTRARRFCDRITHEGGIDMPVPMP